MGHFPPESEIPISLFFQVQHARQRAMFAALTEAGLQDVGQPQILFLLAEESEPPAQSELAGQLRLAPATVAASLKSLERLGYVVRRADPADGRKKRVILTEKGRAARSHCIEIFTRIERQVYDGFTGGELEALRGYYRRMLDNLHQIGGAAGEPCRKGRDPM